MNTSLLLLFFSLLFFNFPADASPRTFGVLRVNKVCRVHDGDTFIVDIANVHPIIGEQISIRIAKIDAPEVTDKREEIKKLALTAKEYLKNRLENARRIDLINIQRDKYFRILADVFVDGENVAAELVAEGLAKPYDGGTKPEW